MRLSEVQGLLSWAAREGQSWNVDSDLSASQVMVVPTASSCHLSGLLSFVIFIYLFLHSTSHTDSLFVSL